MGEEILNPKSIAIVGASTNPKKISTIIMQNLISGGYKGEIYPINPNYEEVLAKKCYSDILAIEKDIDQVCIVVPANAVESIVDQCIEKKVKSVVIISAGFKEIGQEGTKLEKRIAQKLKDASIRLIGPNCLGYINNLADIDLTFARRNPGKGSIAFISQSGAFCTAILDMACADNFGFSYVVSIGNKADIYENELIEFFNKEENVKAIALYVEEITDGKEFVEIAQKSKKPIVIIIPGSSEKAREAIESHTGALASSHDTLVTAFDKANLIPVSSSVELYEVMKILDKEKLPKGEKIAVVTNAGGPGVIATDNIEKEGLSLAEFSEKTKKELKETLPPEAAINNPVDILGDALDDRYEDAINICLNDANVDSILVILTPQLVTDIVGTAEKIIKIQESTKKPIIASFLGKKDVKAGTDLLKEYGITVFNNIELPVKIIKKLVDYNSNINKRKIVKVEDVKKSQKYLDNVKNITTEEVEILPDDIAESILKEFDIDIPEQIITSSTDEALSFAVNRFPVAIKATSKDLAHKTDFKAIHLDIRTVSEFETKIYELRESITKVTGKTSPDILVQQMIEAKAELFIGANREGDSKIYEEDGLGFGHLMAVGQGGIYTEVFKDIKHILLPTDRDNMLEALDQTKISTIINGYRGKPKLAKDKVLDLLEKFQRILISYPQIVTMDINPVMLTEERAIVVDVKMYVKM